MFPVYFVTYVPGSYHPATQNQGGVSFTEDLSEFRQIYLRIQILVSNVMNRSETLSFLSVPERKDTAILKVSKKDFL